MAARKTIARKPGPKPGSTRAPRKATAARVAAAPAAVGRSARARVAALPTPKVSASTAWSIGAVLVAAGAGLAAFLNRGRIGAAVAGVTKAATGTAEGHVPTDLLDPARNADDRAVADFRPDMDAVMTAAEREALRPATGPSPSLVNDRGTMNGQGASAN